ncbi:MAG TPA: DUF1833 family protein [Methylibium sp.]|nr:DUF1833 family protein [Methylibium sp.]
MPTYRPPLRGISQSEALAESAAYAVADAPALFTLAFTHPLIVNPATGEPVGVYVVNAWEDLLATLEADAPLDAGQEVLFRAVPLEITLPTEADNARQGEVSITISNVTRILMPHLEAVSRSPVPVTLIVRTYLPGDTSAPHETPPLRLTLSGATATVQGVTARAGFGDITNRRFPIHEYTPEQFRGLAAS